MNKRILIFTNKDNCDNYVNACKSVSLDATLDSSLDNFDLYDGLLLIGGGDINPLIYGEINTCSRNIEDEFDDKCFKCLDYFVKNNKPVLGICKGMQIINVYFGGTLTQDINNHDLGDIKYHKVKCLNNTLLSNYYDEKILVNSYHHQCVNKLGNNVKVMAISLDNVIEAIINDKVIGIEWHPEKMLDKGGKQAFKMFKDLL